MKFTYTEQDKKNFDALTIGQRDTMNDHIKRTVFIDADAEPNVQAKAINDFATSRSFGSFNVEFVRDGRSVDSMQAVDLRRDLTKNADKFDFYGDDYALKEKTASELVAAHSERPLSPNHEYNIVAYKAYADEKNFEANKGVDVCYLYDENRKASKPILFFTSAQERDDFIKPMDCPNATTFDSKAFKTKVPGAYKNYKVFFHETYEDANKALEAMQERINSFHKYNPQTPDWKSMVASGNIKCTQSVKNIYGDRLPNELVTKRRLPDVPDASVENDKQYE